MVASEFQVGGQNDVTAMRGETEPRGSADKAASVQQT